MSVFLVTKTEHVGGTIDSGPPEKRQIILAITTGNPDGETEGMLCPVFASRAHAAEYKLLKQAAKEIDALTEDEEFLLNIEPDMPERLLKEAKSLETHPKAGDRLYQMIRPGTAFAGGTTEDEELELFTGSGAASQRDFLVKEFTLQDTDEYIRAQRSQEKKALVDRLSPATRKVLHLDQP